MISTDLQSVPSEHFWQLNVTTRKLFLADDLPESVSVVGFVIICDDEPTGLD